MTMIFGKEIVHVQQSRDSVKLLFTLSAPLLGEETTAHWSCWLTVVVC